jgi:hypothetical protein
MTAPNEDTVRRLVEERAVLVHMARDWHRENGRSVRRPVSRDQTTLAFGTNGNRVHSAAEFAAAIRAR